MKRCTKCGVEKSHDEFPPVRRGQTKRQSWCRACFAEANAANYAKNRDREKARLVAQTMARREGVRKHIIDYLAAHPCVDCGETDVVVLEFDHRGEKLADVSTYANGGRSWPRVLAEISKCDVRCANCHRRKTALRLPRDAPAPRRGRTIVQLRLASSVEQRMCRVCGRRLPLTEFTMRSSGEGRHHYICLACQRVFSRLWYQRQVGRPVRVQRPRGSARRSTLVARVLEYLRDHSCVDCGERDPLVLDFDHRRDKTTEISTLVRKGASWERIETEIRKCEVRCANCHRRRTVTESRGYRLAASGTS